MTDVKGGSGLSWEDLKKLRGSMGLEEEEQMEVGRVTAWEVVGEGKGTRRKGSRVIE